MARILARVCGGDFMEEEAGGRMGAGCWVVYDPKDEEIKAAAPTEGQAWISALGMTGRGFTWPMLRDLIAETGYFIAEIRNSSQSR